MAAKTVEVRIAVAVDTDGNIGVAPVLDNNTSEAIADARDAIEDGGHNETYIVTATLPLPETREIAGTVTEVGNE